MLFLYFSDEVLGFGAFLLWGPNDFQASFVMWVLVVFSAPQFPHKSLVLCCIYAHYIHDGNAIGFTLDSMGGISNAALKFTNLLYAKGSGIRRRRWDSDCMRIALKKQFLDSLSAVLCHHRVLDFIFLGIPNRR